VFSKQVLTAVEPKAWVFYRLLAASVVLIPVAVFRARRWPARQHWPAFAVAGILGIFLNQALFIEGLQRTSPAHSSMINALIPLLTLTVAVAARQERLNTTRVLAVALGGAGIFVLFPSGGAPGGAGAEGATLTGDLLTLANATTYAVFLVWMRRISPHADALASTAVFFGLGTVLSLVWAWPALTADSAAALLAPAIWPAALAVVLGATILAYLLNIWALGRTRSSLVALYIYLQPAVSASLGVAMGWRAPGAEFYGAAALILAALLVQVLGDRARRPRLGNA